MPLETVAVIVTIAVGIAGLIAAWAKWWPKLAHLWRRVDGTLDAIGGREAYVDPASGRRVPALPPLTTRMALVESGVKELTETTVQLARTVESLNDAHRRIDDHEVRIHALESGTAERIAARAESAQMWRAVADNDLPDEPEP